MINKYIVITLYGQLTDSTETVLRQTTSVAHLEAKVGTQETCTNSSYQHVHTYTPQKMTKGYH